MIRYTLLRNNQQSGPHTLEDLKDIGLKVYDLIWIDGKSAAWLYAEEIEELAPFTPKIKDIVEESFLEKRATAKIPSILDQYSNQSKTVTNQSSAAVTIAEKPVSEKVSQNNNETFSPARKKIRSKKTIYAETENLPNNTTAAGPLPDFDSERKIPDQPADSNYDNQGSVSVKYVRSLDDIKQEYVSKVLGKETFAAKKSMPVLMLLGVGVLLLIGVGILIGILLQKNSQQPQVTAAVVVPPQNQNTAPEKKMPLNENKPALVTNKTAPVNEYPENENGSFAEEDVAIKEQPQTRKKIATAAGNEITGKSKAAVKSTDSNKKKEYTQEPERDITAVVKKHPDVNNNNAKKENLRQLIKVSSDQYRKAGLFGGLKDITVKTTNYSSHLIDLAVVEVIYILANGKVFKKETLYFKNIPPGSSVSLKAANSSRGAKVDSKLTLVTSKSAEVVSDVSSLVY